jgi:hypothetical protein
MEVMSTHPERFAAADPFLPPTKGRQKAPWLADVRVCQLTPDRLGRKTAGAQGRTPATKNMITNHYKR